MAMSSEDFDHLLFDHPISKTMEEAFCVPMNVETQLSTTGYQQESSDNGFCEDQTMISTDTEFESVPTSPSISSTFFSHSPSSESGIEDDHDDDSKLGFKTFSDLSNHGDQTFSPLPVQKQPAVTSTVSDAYEELKQLLYAVVTTNATSLPTVPTCKTVNTSVVTSMVDFPGPSDLTRECSNAQAAASQSATPSTASSGNLPSMLPSGSKTNLKCVRRTRRQRDKPKLVILDEPEEVFISYIYYSY